MSRDHNREFQDQAGRQYAYEFDYIHREYMMRAFEPLLPAGRALEMGCYQGAFTRTLAGRFDDLTVIEAASDLIMAARQNAPAHVRFVHSTFETWEAPETYDAVFLIHTLEHLDDPVAVLRQVNEWLSPAGRLFLVVPNAHAPSRQIAVKMGLISHNDAVTEGEYAHGHRRTYAFDTLERDARAAGLDILHRGGVMFKALANFQLDRALAEGIIDRAYLDGCYAFGMEHPELCASIFLVCGKGGTR